MPSHQTGHGCLILRLTVFSSATICSTHFSVLSQEKYLSRTLYFHTSSIKRRLTKFSGHGSLLIYLIRYHFYKKIFDIFTLLSANILKHSLSKIIHCQKLFILQLYQICQGCHFVSTKG